MIYILCMFLATAFRMTVCIIHIMCYYADFIDVYLAWKNMHGHVHVQLSMYRLGVGTLS